MRSGRETAPTLFLRSGMANRAMVSLRARMAARPRESMHPMFYTKGGSNALAASYRIRGRASYRVRGARLPAAATAILMTVCFTSCHPLMDRHAQPSGGQQPSSDISARRHRKPFSSILAARKSTNEAARVSCARIAIWRNRDSRSAAIEGGCSGRTSRRLAFVGSACTHR